MTMSSTHPRRASRGGWEVPAAPLRPLIDKYDSTTKLAELTGLADKTIRRIKSGQRSTHIDTADRICIELGLHLRDVYGDDGYKCPVEKIVRKETEWKKSLKTQS